MIKALEQSYEKNLKKFIPNVSTGCNRIKKDKKVIQYRLNLSNNIF